jgi:UDP-N-acetylglucosamine transferase subunit ALG13
MILCLTGTNPYSFKRMVMNVDLQIANKYSTIIQKGNTKYTPINAKYFEFVEKSKISELFKQSDLIITQGGYGSMIDAIKLNKKIIAVPRKINLGESLDDQIELVQYFEKKNYVVGCYDIDLLETLVNKCINNEFAFNRFKPESENLISDVISKYINCI